MGWKRVVLCAAVAAAAVAARAGDEPRMKPFVLASRGAGEVAKTAEDVRGKLGAAGFTIAGSYEPYPGAVVLAVTSDELRAAAAQVPAGGYAAAQRVSITKVGGEVQVAYTNPRYMAVAYRLKSDLATVAEKLARTLGSVEEYGPPEGLRAKDLERYRYMFGMPRFDDPWKLAFYGSHAEALASVDGALAARRGKTRLVYKIDVSPEQTVYGVALEDGCGADANVMKEIDFKPLRATGHLPYELLVTGSEVRALHAKFRIAVNFPDLSMMGEHSFMKIMCAPDSIEASLAAAAGAARD
jgi:hypothetical protein